MSSKASYWSKKETRVTVGGKIKVSNKDSIKSRLFYLLRKDEDPMRACLRFPQLFFSAGLKIWRGDGIRSYIEPKDVQLLFKPLMRKGPLFS
jgi:hypothetical protein